MDRIQAHTSASTESSLHTRVYFSTLLLRHKVHNHHLSAALVDVVPLLHVCSVIERTFRDCCACCATSSRFYAFVIRIGNAMVLSPPAYGRRFPKDLQLAFLKAHNGNYFHLCERCILMLLMHHPPSQHMQTYVRMCSAVKCSLRLHRCHRG